MKHRNLAAERVRLGMTQKQLADALGCSVSTIVCAEKDTARMRMELLDKAASLFGCTVDYLLDRTERR